MYLLTFRLKYASIMLECEYMQIQKQQQNGIEWINIIDPDKTVARFLHEYGIHPIHIQNSFDQSNHSKIEHHDGYVFIASTFPIYNPKRKNISSSEIDFFLFDTKIITIHHNEIPVVNGYFKLCKYDPDIRSKAFSENPSIIIALLFEKLIDYCSPIIDHIVENIENIEDKIFHQNDKELIGEILWIQRNLIDFQRIFKPLLFLMKSFAKQKKDVIHDTTIPYINNIIDKIQKMNQLLDSHQETINMFRIANDSLVQDRFSKTVKVLTIYSLILGPINFFLSQIPWKINGLEIFSSQTVFFIVLTLFFGIIIGFITFFRYKRWY